MRARGTPCLEAQVMIEEGAEGDKEQKEGREEGRIAVDRTLLPDVAAVASCARSLAAIPAPVAGRS